MTNVMVAEGFLQSDATMKYVGSKETPLLTFTLVNTTGFGDYKNTNYLDCELWGKTADKVEQYFKEGLRITVNGEMIHDRWQADDGTKRSRWKLKIRDFSFGGGNNTEAKPKAEPKEDAEKDAASYAFDEDIPF